jgi:hypothetical protein
MFQFHCATQPVTRYPRLSGLYFPHIQHKKIMAIIRCNKCTLLAEQPDDLTGQSIACPGCGDPCELDVFMLIDAKVPVCIECKTGEFRQNIDRYLSLRKRLGIEAKQFVMCIAGLSDENTKAFSAMYDLAFVNERSLAGHLGRLF